MKADAIPAEAAALQVEDPVKEEAELAEVLIAADQAAPADLQQEVLLMKEEEAEVAEDPTKVEEVEATVETVDLVMVVAEEATEEAPRDEVEILPAVIEATAIEATTIMTI